MKRRILLGLLPLLLLLLAMGAYAVALFARLGGAVDVILRENYRSIVAAQKMKEALDRMDAGALLALSGKEGDGRKLYEANLPLLQENLRAELANITLPGERELAEKLKQLIADYTRRETLFFQGSAPDGRRESYLRELRPLYTESNETAQGILVLNQEHMLRADAEARQMAAASGRYMMLAIAFGTGVALFLAYRLQRSIVRPLQAVTGAVRELGEGNYDQVVPVATSDELGTMADAFNKMAARLRVYRQTTDEKLVRARQTTASTFSALPDPILVLGLDGAVEFQNPAAVRLLAHWDQQAWPAALQERVAEVLKSGVDYLPGSFAEALCVRVNEAETFLLPRIVGLPGEQGGTPAAAVLLQDVTRLRLLDDVKTNLVATVSHELKTPLTSLRLGVHLLLEEKIGPLNPKQTELLLAGREDTERLLRMINDLLDLARLESGVAQFTWQTVRVEDLLETVLGEANAQAEAAGVRIALEAAADLGALRVEPQRIGLVFANLISNAIKHSPPGESVVLRANREAGGGVRFSVADHGPGIPLEFQSRIFERFFRVPGSDKAGAGLGLAIAREIALAHGGHLGVQSMAGGGAEFSLVLPEA